jgi:WD repeat-containing protein 42A
VKGVNFYGPGSEFIVSGSDCGNVFFWDKETEGIVNVFRGDKEGVVSTYICRPWHLLAFALT